GPESHRGPGSPGSYRKISTSSHSRSNTFARRFFARKWYGVAACPVTPILYDPVWSVRKCDFDGIPPPSSTPSWISRTDTGAQVLVRSTVNGAVTGELVTVNEYQSASPAVCRFASNVP